MCRFEVIKYDACGHSISCNTNHRCKYRKRYLKEFDKGSSAFGPCNTETWNDASAEIIKLHNLCVNASEVIHTVSESPCEPCWKSVELSIIPIAKELCDIFIFEEDVPKCFELVCDVIRMGYLEAVFGMDLCHRTLATAVVYFVMLIKKHNISLDEINQNRPQGVSPAGIYKIYFAIYQHRAHLINPMYIAQGDVDLSLLAYPEQFPA